MPKYLIDVDDIKAAHWHTRKDLKKMFSNAKEAVEVLASYDIKQWNNHHLENNKWVERTEVNGKPVTLYAVVKEANNGEV